MANSVQQELLKLRQEKKQQPLNDVQRALLEIRREPVVGFQERELPGGFSKPLPQFAAGVGRSIIGTIAGASSLGERFLRGATRAALPKILERAIGISKEQVGDKTAAEQLIPEELRTAGEDRFGKAGFISGEIGQFLAPTPAGKTGALLEGTKLAQKFPKAIKIVPKALKEAGFDFGLTATQQGDIDKASIEAGLISLAFPAANILGKKAFDPVKSYLSTKVAPDAINELVRPLVSAFNFGKDPGRGVVKEGIIANTREGLLKGIVVKSKQLGQQVDQKLKTISAEIKIDIEPLLEPLNTRIGDAFSGGETVLANRLMDIRSGIKNIFIREGPQAGKVAGTNILKLSPFQANNLKRKISDRVKWNNQPFDDEANAARIQIYRAINDKIDEVVPGAKDLNRRWADLITAEKSLDRTIKMVKKNKFIGLRDLTIGGITGLGAVVAGSPQAFLIGLGAIAGKKGLESTVFRTRLAQQLIKLKPKELEELSRTLPILKAILLGTKSSKEKE